ncbi:MAG: HAD family hydrolase [Pseudomonadota bacterium]
MVRNNIKAVLFDLDGVLVDAREWHYEALNRALALFGYSISRYDHLTTFDGLPTREKLKQLSVTDNLPVGLHKLINSAKQSYTRDAIAQHCDPVFHIEYAVARLKREGYSLGVCTNSIRSTLHLMLDRNGLMPYFDLLLSNEDIAKPKPDPEIYLTAIDRLSLTPGEVLIVEDNQHGVAAARAAGANVLQVADPSEVHYANISQAIKTAEVTA